MKQFALFFTKDHVRRYVPRAVPGVYILGNFDPVTGKFTRVYVGRSDSELRTRLANHEHQEHAEYFSAIPCTSEKEAFHMECYLWHASELDQLRNRIHPAAPAKSGLSCPLCAAGHRFADFAVARFKKKLS